MKKFFKWVLILFIGFFLLGVVLNLVGVKGSDNNTSEVGNSSEKENLSIDSTQTQQNEIKTESHKIDFKLDSVELAKCTAAAMKSQKIDVFSKWYDVLKAKYGQIYPNKSPKELDDYALERVLDKRRYLESKGYDSKPAFNKYYQMNCAEFEPK
ncbi:hypothetical protein AV645_07055 [Acinetobacter calcoaceticus]|uniref:Uncharacterized protein n=1 Tax=Acinetobacter oleivorans TaxID=1148157 RepID=A0A0B2UHV6_9GAMM|nr:hypothetical protein [Acinetobacter calcoaceticus]KHN68774.1 hypothetical protein DH17_00425 [Acinetobacter oleivorans]KUM11427.1 hypothetical protein AV645_07055 [Acinetobacter calcoaceticus]